mgnify:CR=1 FL=1
MSNVSTRVLVVDDEAPIRRFLRAALTAHGYEVLEARNGQEALSALTAQRPDLLILDVMMEHPGAGYDFNQAVRFASEYIAVQQVPIVMVSALPVDPATRFCMAGEAAMITPDAYLTKPLDIPEFLDTVKAFLDRKRKDEGRG